MGADMELEKEPDDLSLSELLKIAQGLTANAVWIRLCAAIQAQVDSLQSEVLFGEVTSEGDVFRLERRKGMLEGRLSIAGTLQGMMDTWAQDLRNITGEERNED